MCWYLWEKKKIFKPRPENRNLVPVKGSYQIFRRVSPSFLCESPPPGSFKYITFLSCSFLKYCASCFPIIRSYESIEEKLFEPTCIFLKSVWSCSLHARDSTFQLTKPNSSRLACLWISGSIKCPCCLDNVYKRRVLKGANWLINKRK